MRGNVSIRVALVAAAFCASMLLCGMAVADPVELWPPCSYAGTLTLVPGYAAWCADGFDVHMHAGQTMVATISTSPSVTDVHLYSGLDGGDYSLEASQDSTSVQTIEFASWGTGTFTLLLDTSAPGTYTIDVAAVPAPAFHLGTMHAPKSVSRKTPFIVWTTLSDYDALGIPVRFMFDRRVRGRWRPFSSCGAIDIISDTPPWWHYAGYPRLPRGTFRVRARFRDPAHPVAQYGRWKTITVR